VLRDQIELEQAKIGMSLILIAPKRTMVAKAAASQFHIDGFDPVSRIQIVTVKEALRLRDHTAQGALDL